MSTRRSSAGVDRTAFRVVEWADHTGAHDARLREYWLEQSIDARLAAAMRCRWRVTGAMPPLDRGHLRLIDFVGRPPNQIHVLTQISGVTFDEALEDHVSATYGSVPVRYIGLAALLRNKRTAARPKDLADVAALQAGRGDTDEG